MLTYWLVETITGARVAQVALSDFSWSRKVNGGIGSGRATIPTADTQFASVPQGAFLDWTRAWAMTLVACWNGVPFYAGVLDGKTWDYDATNGNLSFTHSEVGELLRRRLFWGAGSYSKTAKKSWTGQSRQAVLIDATREVVGGGAGVEPVGNFPWRLPVFFPSAIAGTRERTTLQHEFERPWDWMVAVSEEVNGEDFVFEPGFNTDGNGFQWVMYVGSPRLSRSNHEWHVSAPQSPVTAAKLQIDASELLTGVFALGKGSGADMVVGMASPPDGVPRTPAMDSTVSVKDAESTSAANALAAGALAQVVRPQRLWTVQARVADALAPDGPKVGGTVRLLYGGREGLPDRVLGSGFVDLYVIGMSSVQSDPGLVSLEVQAL